MMSASEAPAASVFGLPRVPRTAVSRPRLTELITKLLQDHDLVIIRAPSGAGKTVALAEWAASGRTPGCVSWISVDERYIDRTSFWREIILGTVPQVHESIHHLILECAEALVAGADVHSVLRRFIPCLPRTVVVIDKMDLIQDQELFEDIAWVLRTWSHVQAVAATRKRSPLESPTASLSLDTAVIGGAPFQLTISETAELLAIRGVSMDPAALCSATSGHPMLTRAAITVYEQAGTKGIFSSINTVVEDFLYLSLSKTKLGAEAREFMIRTSIPESFTLELASKLTGAADATELLDDLEDQGLGMWFSVSGHRHFEYNPSVRSLLLQSLKGADPRVVDRLTRIVIESDLAAGNAINALRQAVAIGDLDLASRIFCDHHVTLLLSQSQAALAILEDLPISQLRKHPALIMALALCHNMTASGRGKALEYFGLAVVFAGMYKNYMDPGQRIWMLALESTALRYAGKLELALKFAKRAVESFEESPWELREQLSTTLEPTLYTQAGIAHIHAKEFDAAEQLLIKALDATRRSETGPAVFLITGLLAFTLAMAGKTAEARTHLDWLDRHRWPPGMLDGAWATAYRLAQIREAMDRQSYDEAQGYLDLINEEMQVSEHWPTIVTFRAVLDLHCKGQPMGPVTLEAKIRQANKWPLNTSGQIDLDHLRAVSYLIAGQPQNAAAAIIKHTKDDPRVLLMRARIAIYTGNPAKAIALTSGFDWLGPRMEMQRLLLRSAAMERLQNIGAARDYASAAASLMQEHGLTMTAVLLPQEDMDRLVEHVHTQEPAIPGPIYLVPELVKAVSLTPREMVVLNAFAVHGQASAVAAALNVSLNTVKSQRRSVLKKLGVSSLEEALAAARLQRLLED